MADLLARFLGGPPLSVLARLLMLSLIVGALLMWLDIHPMDVIDSVERLFRRLWNLGFGAVRLVLEYVIAGAVIVVSDALFFQRPRLIAELAQKHRLPSISAFREYAKAGVLMSYGQNRNDSFRRAATYVDKILKGAKPGDLPVEQPTKFELIINGKTAKALGIEIPPRLLATAYEVIE